MMTEHRAGTYVYGDVMMIHSFNKVYAQYFGDTLPARSCVRSDMMIDCKVEIEVIAFIDRNGVLENGQ
jgi:enamine deaminase RidA (YjgF/YER057c/UK114 family)